MIRPSFYQLCNLLRKESQKNEEMGSRYSAGSITVPDQVAFFIRMLANAQYLDIMLTSGDSMPAVYICTHSVSAAVVKILPQPGLPRTESTRHFTALNFEFSSSGLCPFKFCVGAVDSIAIQIRIPHSVSNPAQYSCRKSYCCIQVQAVVDGNYRFLYFFRKFRRFNV